MGTRFNILKFFSFISQGKAVGNLCALWIRWKVQRQLESLGHFIQKHSGKVLFVGLLLLSLCCVGLKTVTIETNVEKLWVEGKTCKDVKNLTS